MPENRITRVLALELKLLRCLCDDVCGEESRELIVRQLSAHHWKSADHRVVFEAIARLGGRDPLRLRSELPAQATRMGFPDIDWASYFAPGETPPDELQALVRELAAGTSLGLETDRT